MTKILFVCKGNINRSVMAAALFRQLLVTEGLTNTIEVDSAGTSYKHCGEPPYPGTRRILEKHRISTQGIRSRQVTAEDISQFDFVIAMDRNNIHKLKKMFGEINVKLFLEFTPQSYLLDVPDPSLTGEYEFVFQMIQDGCKHILSFIKEKEGLHS